MTRHAWKSLQGVSSPRAYVTAVALTLCSWSFSAQGGPIPILAGIQGRPDPVHIGDITMQIVNDGTGNNEAMTATFEFVDPWGGAA